MIPKQVRYFLSMAGVAVALGSALQGEFVLMVLDLMAGFYWYWTAENFDKLAARKRNG